MKLSEMKPEQLESELNLATEVTDSLDLLIKKLYLANNTAPSDLLKLRNYFATKVEIINRIKK